MVKREEAPLATIISWVLRTGVALSCLVIGVGLVLLFVHQPGYRSGRVSYRMAIGSFHSSHSIGAVVHEIARGDGAGVIMVGLAILLATPVVRVGVSLVEFAWQRDLRMALITGLVLVILVGSIFLGGVV